MVAGIAVALTAKGTTKMDQEQEEFANWQAAKTKKRRMWQAHERAENDFKGASHWDRTKLGEIDVVRLSV
ncbi:MAG: hypothetical protein K2X29_04725, partial [Candidatus Obscuribacterales bacterium]|nr:hypothetical protein [Candidatus Obscuribacterales bacterium]